MLIPAGNRATTGNRAAGVSATGQATRSPGCVASATPSAIPSGATVAVPSVIGMTRLQAEQILQAAGFTVILHAETRAGQSWPAGEVWSQTVPAGAKAPRGTTITLDVVPN